MIQSHLSFQACKQFNLPIIDFQAANLQVRFPGRKGSNPKKSNSSNSKQACFKWVEMMKHPFFVSDDLVRHPTDDSHPIFFKSWMFQVPGLRLSGTLNIHLFNGCFSWTMIRNLHFKNACFTISNNEQIICCFGVSRYQLYHLNI